jgi:uncharacterized membrane protein
MSIALLFHLLAVVIWVGGMFFALMALRPAAVTTLQPPQRLPLFAATLAYFFKWVTGAIVVILVTGFYLIAMLGGIRAVGTYIHAMMTLGIVMMLIFVHLRVVSYRRLQAAVATQSWPDAGAAMASVRRFVWINLGFGVVTIAVAVLGRGL